MAAEEEDDVYPYAWTGDAAFLARVCSAYDSVTAPTSTYANGVGDFTAEFGLQLHGEYAPIHQRVMRMFVDLLGVYPSEASEASVSAYLAHFFLVAPPPARIELIDWIVRRDSSEGVTRAFARSLVGEEEFLYAMRAYARLPAKTRSGVLAAFRKLPRNSDATRGGIIRAMARGSACAYIIN